MPIAAKKAENLLIAIIDRTNIINAIALSAVAFLMSVLPEDHIAGYRPRESTS